MKFLPYELQLLIPGVTPQHTTPAVASEAMYLEPQPSLQCSSTEIDFTDPPEEVMNFSTKAGAVSQAWSMAGTVGKSFTAKVSVLGRLHLQVYDSVMNQT